MAWPCPVDLILFKDTIPTNDRAVKNSPYGSVFIIQVALRELLRDATPHLRQSGLERSGVDVLREICHPRYRRAGENSCGMYLHGTR